MKKDVVVIGAGPGGYVAAIRLGQLGKSVAIIDKSELGGVCLNWGCIPSKALIHAGKVLEEINNAEEMGINVKKVSINLSKTQEWKKGVVKKLTSGIGQLLQAAGVQIMKGEATFETPNRVRIKGVNSGQDTVEFKSAIIATGSHTIEIPGFAIDGEKVVDAKHALEWTEAPKRMVIIGGGVIGMEIGMMYQKFGTQVTVVEFLPQILPGTDAEISQTLQRICKKREIKIYTSSKALSYEKKKDGLHVTIETAKGKEALPCDVILLSVGRAPNSGKLGLETIGVKIGPKGFVTTNKKLQTNLPHIYAIGDVAGMPQLAHKASKEGLVAAECIAGHNEEYDVRAMPGAIFTDPEIATVGLTEEEAQKNGIKTFSGKFPFAASGRALSTRQTEGFIKVVGEQGTKRLLGVHMIGAGSSDMISEAAHSIEMGASVEDLALTVHPHPTLSESLMEAAEASLGRAIHMVNRTDAPSTPRKRELEHAK